MFVRRCLDRVDTIPDTASAATVATVVLGNVGPPGGVVNARSSRPSLGKEVKIYMLLQAYTFVRVTGGDFRSRVHDRFVELTHSETGATAAEYALLVSLIAIVIVIGAFALGNAINDRLGDTATCVGGAPGAACGAAAPPP
jgi:Flp pilus assembly pilin Flp